MPGTGRERTMPLGRRGDRDGWPVERGDHEVRGTTGGGAVPRVPPSDAAFWRRPWTRSLAVSCCRTFASSLTSSSEALEGVDGPD